METFIGIGIFVFALLVIEGGYFAVRDIRRPELKIVRRRMKGFSSEGRGNEPIDIVRERLLSEVPWLNRALSGLHWMHNLNRLLEQAGIQSPLGLFVLLSLLLAFAGFFVGSLVTASRLTRILGIALPAMAPLFYIHSKKKRRMRKFERQLPDALGMIARSLKAGHAFSGGLKMVADEFSDPVGTEFDKTLDEINFGAGIPEALKNMANRVDCPDLKFFIVSVIIQRETGGNLAEILENIAYLIRQRFKLRGRIRAVSAEGKLSAIILTALPILVAVAISLLNPEYLGVLTTDPIGKVLVGLAILMLAMGIFTMKRMIAIKV